MDTSRGKGGHVTQWIGDRFPVVKTGEIGSGLLSVMMKQRDTPKDAF